MFVLFHPQMLELHRLCLGRDEVFFGTSQSNAKAAGDPGARWHSHGGLCDGSGDALNTGINDRRLRDPDEYMAAGHCNLVLACQSHASATFPVRHTLRHNHLADESCLPADPAGFEGSSGCINIIRGSHLYCDTAADNSALGIDYVGPEEENAAMRRGWLSGKPHPVTGAPMDCEEVRLPPGSLVACVSHAAHRVNPTAAAGPGRLAMSLFAHGADARTGHVQAGASLPPLWTLRAMRRELPDAACEFFRNAHDRELTGGRDATQDPESRVKLH